MKQTDESVSKAKSGSKVAALSSSKLSSRFWVNRVKQVRGHGFYFGRFQHAGRRELVNLGTTDKRQASEIAARTYAQIRSQGWDAALRVLNPDRHRPNSAVTVGDVVRTLESVDLRPRTRDNYCHGLRWWAAQHLNTRPGRKEFGRRSEEYRARLHAVRLNDLSLERLEKIRDTFISRAGDDTPDQRRARISVKSFHRNASAGISAAERLGHLKMPEPKPFAGLVVRGANPLPYVSEHNAAQELQKAREELQTADPETWRAYLLALAAGLERKSALALRWADIRQNTSQIFVVEGGTFQAKADQRYRMIPVDPQTIVLLGPPDDADALVIPGGSATWDRAVKWRREQGNKANKVMHNLRKEYGSALIQQAGIDIASRLLGHSNTNVTQQSYFEIRRKAGDTVGIGAMLAGGAA
jgi:integrase